MKNLNYNTMLSDEQIHTEIEKQFQWLYGEPKQKQFLMVPTRRCDVYNKNTCPCWGIEFKLPAIIRFDFLVTNDHIEREDCKYKVAEFDFKTLNYN